MQKCFVNPAMGLLRKPMRIKKNSGTLFCVGLWLVKISRFPVTQNSLRLRFGSDGCADLQLFF